MACPNSTAAERLDKYETTMLTHISIENFKGIRDRVEIELKPITLLFGPNSAGKSTVLHALLYAQEVFERHNLNADTTQAGGPIINLGGFKSIVHGHDLGLPIGLGLQFNLEEGEWKDYRPDKDAFQFILGCQAERLLATPSSAGVFLRICWADEVGRPFVQSCRLQLDSVDFAEITAAPFSESRTLRLLNPNHPLLLRGDSGSPSVEVLAGEEPSAYVPGPAASENPSLLHLALEELHVPVPKINRTSLSLRGEDDALLRSESSVQIGQRFRLKSWSAEEAGSRYKMVEDIQGFLDSAVTGTLRSLRNRLRGFRYLGPVREIPPRNAAPPSSPDPARWSTGLGAWDRLQTCDSPFFAEVSDWLNSPKRLNARVRLGRRELIPLDLAQRVLADLLSERLSPKRREMAAKRLDDLPIERRVFLVANDSEVELSLHDVGVGISQLVPVLVTALDESTKLAGIEEPDYHVHPRLQAELGDLLIESAVRRRAVLLVETHSEHLLLRLLRRVREKAQATLPKGYKGLRPDQIAVVYVDSTDGHVRVTRLQVTEDGDFAGSWPEGFFDERAKELF